MAFMPPARPTYRMDPARSTMAVNEALAFELMRLGSRGGAVEEQERDWRPFEPQLPMTLLNDVATRRGSRLAALYLQQPDADYCLVFSHGNAVDLGMMAVPLAMLAAHLNVSVFAYDYSGYGLSTGRLREANLYADIEAAVEALKTRFGPLGGKHELTLIWRNPVSSFSFNVAPEQIILYGQSIGTVPTVDYASKHPEVAAVILHSPLASGLRVLRPTMKRTWCCDPFPSIEKVHRIEVPLLIIHGTADEVIDFSHSEALHARCPNAKVLWIDGAGHNDMEERLEFQYGLEAFVTALRSGEADIATQPTAAAGRA